MQSWTVKITTFGDDQIAHIYYKGQVVMITTWLGETDSQLIALAMNNKREL